MRVYDPQKSTVEVRGADRRQGSKRVLIISTAVVIIAFALLYWWFAAHSGAGINHGY